ncbi:MAG: hypothetical protein F6J89_09600 [Symploca sp. SIO1C4]|uniref:Uncharacterized protein n=1 Tax=Symploca sp. SIO1C4 TaxID=2607765 RepID=A0A6B3N466_9CYAN|nr:hypothetical protein [Symploca sp. SIO1C4]NET08034.1 hypothetical protein [Symploca sp. SIO2B6]NET50699.1 hypothetical protein [Merismopedia sp. SIO2A8]
MLYISLYNSSASTQSRYSCQKKAEDRRQRAEGLWFAKLLGLLLSPFRPQGRGLYPQEVKLKVNASAFYPLPSAFQGKSLGNLSG